MMTKMQMIDAIRQLNRTVPTEYLTAFDEYDLRSYLQRLEHLFNHRGSQSIWVRPADTHAVVTMAA